MVTSPFSSKMVFLYLSFGLLFSLDKIVAEPREGYCDSRRFSEGALLTRHDTALEGYVQHTVFTPGFISCSHCCLGYIWCISINYEYNADPVGACELNSRGVLDPSHGKRADLVSKDNYVFSQLRSDKVRFDLCDNVLEKIQ